jgi:alcohol dehydrogenase class IV
MQKAFVNQGVSVLNDILTNDIKSIFIVTGNSSYNSVKKLISPYLSNIKTTLFFNKGAGIDNIEQGCTALERSNADMVLAIGGGANIDLAKLINTFVLLPNKDYLDIIKGKKTINKKNLPVIAMPTTAGTGSESTSFSVVYLGLDKYSVSSEYLLPDYVIADYDLIKKAPKYLQACTAFDAFSQAIESFWAASATKVSRGYAEQAIKLTKSSLLPSIKHQDKSSMKNMVYAAYLSGKAINISKTTAPHALSYYLTVKYNIPHGHAVALMLGVMAKLNIDYGDQALNSIMQEVANLLKIDLLDFSKYWYDLMRQCGLEVELSKFGIKEADLNLIVERVNLERLRNHPLSISKISLLSELKEIL